MSNTALLLPSPDQATANHRRAVITVQQGSWKWQKRHGIACYRAEYTRDGRLIWRSLGKINDKVKPREVERLLGRGYHYGSLHNRSCN